MVSQGPLTNQCHEAQIAKRIIQSKLQIFISMNQLCLNPKLVGKSHIKLEIRFKATKSLHDNLASKSNLKDEGAYISRKEKRGNRKQCHGIHQCLPSDLVKH